MSRLPSPNDPYLILRTTEGCDVLVSFESFLKCKNLSWHIHQASGSNYRRVYHKTSDNKNLYIHRFILDAKEGELVDHINGNPLDNRLHNLRFTDHSGNSRNHGLNKNNTSGYKGVSHRGRGKFRAYICVDRKHINLGTFASREDAARAYNNAAIKYFGEFARLNNVNS